MQDLAKEIKVEDAPNTSFADVADLLVPIFVLIVSTIIAFLYSGGFFTSSTGIIEATGEGNIVMSLVYGGIFAIITAAILYIPKKKVSSTKFVPVFFNGVGKMVTAVLILILAWSVGEVIEQLETGKIGR